MTDAPRFSGKIAGSMANRSLTSLHASTTWFQEEFANSNRSAMGCKIGTGHAVSVGECHSRRSWTICTSGMQWRRCSSMISRTGSSGDGQQMGNTRQSPRITLCTKALLRAWPQTDLEDMGTAQGKDFFLAHFQAQALDRRSKSEARSRS